MKHAHTRHLRCITPYEEAQEAFNRASHGDALREMQVAPFDHATPLNVIRSIDRAEMLCAAFLFVSAFVGIGVFFAMGTK